MRLHLHVREQYFEEAKSGKKKLEFRLVNDYWKGRLILRGYDGIIYYNAYKAGSENRMEFPWNGWEVQTITHEHFGRYPVSVYAIHLDPIKRVQK